MRGNSKVNKSIRALRAMATEYGVEENALWMATMEQYVVQVRMIDMIRRELDKSDDLAVSKEYVKGRENIYAHPLVKELPKHSDAANRTCETLLDIIKVLGKKKEVTDGFDDFLEERDQM